MGSGDWTRTGWGGGEFDLLALFRARVASLVVWSSLDSRVTMRALDRIEPYPSRAFGLRGRPSGARGAFGCGLGRVLFDPYRWKLMINQA